MYQEIYDLITTYVYGSAGVAGSAQELTTTLIATIACLFMISLPFLVVKKVIDIIGG